MCGHPSSKNRNTDIIETDDMELNSMHKNLQNQWIIPPTESLFEAWMSINPNLNAKTGKKVSSRSSNYGIQYYKLNYYGSTNNFCVSVDDDKEYLLVEGEK